MNQKNLTNADLSRALGVNERTVVKIIADPFRLTLRQLAIITALLETKIEFLAWYISRHSTHKGSTDLITEKVKNEAISFGIVI